VTWTNAMVIYAIVFTAIYVYQKFCVLFLREVSVTQHILILITIPAIVALCGGFLAA